ncbi:MAG: HNH endonuclease [Candidatus Thiodiazotropha lotti]|nr:HNH endonuclease [Candidatus Thiodiazotropha lotti]MCW4187854.1 HNH endonuclease [Candidatus Thiodiazotropha lotti]
MRPVERGEAPQEYAKYGDAIGDLEERLGNYCSYCERRLPASLAVEHMSPKDLVPERKLDWDNFLLGCVNCNSVKGVKNLDDEACFWPDRDNTLRAIQYEAGGFVSVADDLGPTNRERAVETINLVGLDRHGGLVGKKPARRDKRWSQRDEAWEAAVMARNNYDELNQCEAARNLVIQAAVGLGFFSVWLKVFGQYPEVIVRLIEAFKGTSADCFGADFSFVNRPGGLI